MRKENLHYCVYATCQASKYEKPFKRLIASFDLLTNAEDFIEKCLPAENKDRFSIERI